MLTRTKVLGLTIAILLILVMAPYPHTGGSNWTAQGSSTGSETLPESLLIADAQFVYNSPFDIQTFLDSRQAILGDYEIEFGGEKQSAAEIIEFYAHLYSLNPKVLLTLIQLRTALLDERLSSEDNLALPLRHSCEDCVGFAEQLSWASEMLVRNFYNYPRQSQLVFADGQLLTAPSEWNAGTFAIAALLALDATPEILGSAQSGELVAFRTIYADLFGSPFASTIAESQVHHAAMPTLKLPWTADKYWWFTGGPHNHAGGPYGAIDVPHPWSALDFAPPGSGCRIPDGWVVAAAGGKVASASSPLVKIDHDGDGNAGTGWVTWYLHLDSIQVQEGQSVSAGTELGKPSCEGCKSSHVHFAIAYNGEFQDIDGTVVSGWTVHETTTHYNGTMTKGGVTKTADRVHDHKDYTNRLRSDNSPEGTVILDFTARLSGAPDDDQSVEVEVHVFRFVTLLGPELVFHDTVTTDNYGNYSGLTLSGVTPGIYSVYVKPVGYLRRGIREVPLSTGANHVDFSNGGNDKLVAGDIDVKGGDNLVNGLDYGVWRRDWCPTGGCPGSIADFNRDGVVNAIDYTHIYNSWFEEGDGWTGFPTWAGAGASDNVADPHSSQVSRTTSETTACVDTTPSPSNVSVGETVDVHIRIDGNNIPLDAVDVIVEYDSCVFEVQEVSSSSVLSSMSHEVDADSNLVRIVGDFGTGSPYTHDGYEILATITLVAVASPESGVTDVQATIVGDEDVRETIGTLDSNTVEHDTGLDVISGGSFDLVWVEGAPVRSSSVVTLTQPPSDSYIDGDTVQLSAEVGGTCSYANACSFAYRRSGNESWTWIGHYDETGFDGWSKLWDLSDRQDGVYDVKAWAGPWAGVGATAINRNITVDRTPPSLVTATFSPLSPSDADTVEIYAEASDNVAGVDHTTVFHYRATDGSTSGDLVYIGTITGSAGTMQWDTSQLPNGTYRVVFEIKDTADNWDFWTGGNQPEFTYRINRCTEVYLPLVLRNYTPSTEPPNRPPNTPSNPSPSDGATNQPITVTLSWTGVDPDGDSVTYDVYFEADDDTPDVLLSDDQSGTSYNPGTLSAGTRYYWQIVATDEHGATTTGPVWDFTTTVSRTCYARLNDDPTDYATVQAAVDAADEGDTVKVAGYCSGVEARTGVTQTVYISKSITLRGGYTTANWATSNPISHPTTLDAQGQGCVLYITGEISPIIEGLRITDGYASSGGGIYIVTATATISNNKVFSNTAFFGGGLLLQASDAKIRNNTVTSNTAVLGGGLLLGSGAAVLAGNIVRSNTAEWDGGGLFLYESASTLTSNTISFNSADSGGGLDLHYSDAMISGNTLVANTAHEGGGLFLYETSLTLEENTIISNTAGEGGGLHIYRSDATFTNNVIADNQSDTRGSGLYIDRSLTRLLHSTIARNKGGDGSGVYVTSYGGSHSTIALTNTILVSHAVGISATEGNTVTVNGVLWYNTPITISQVATTTVIVQNQHQGDPAFAADGYHLTVSSAAIDKGVDAGVITDVDGDSRPQGAAFDLGADEYMSGATTHRYRWTSPPGLPPAWYR